MRVRIHRHADVAVAHQVLQRFRVHACLRLQAAVGVATYVRRDVRHLLPENVVVPVHHVVEPVFPVHGNLRHPVFIQKQESAVPVNDLLNLRSLPGLQNPPEALCHIIIHRQLPGTRVRLGFFDHVPHVAGALELMIDVEDLVLQVNIPDGQSAEFGNPDSGVEQDVDHIVVLAVTIVVMDKLQEFVHLLFRNRFSGHGIIHHHSR